MKKSWFVCLDAYNVKEPLNLTRRVKHGDTGTGLCRSGEARSVSLPQPRPTPDVKDDECCCSLWHMALSRHIVLD